MTIPVVARLRAGLEGLRDARQRRKCRAGRGTRILATGRIVNPQVSTDAISIGEFTWIAGELLVFPQSGRIRIGDYCYIGDGTRIWSCCEVDIGNRVFFAHGVNLHDNDAHSRSARERHAHFRELVTRGTQTFSESVESAPTVIEDDAWIGFNSTILKGVRIGRGAIVGAGSVVTRDVAPYTVVVGNPANVVAQAQE
ncbi:MAG TPA: acyltransferase [Pseudolabrys sp.]|nr:acyltransferase [Pseudolabrys sp.]